MGLDSEDDDYLEYLDSLSVEELLDLDEGKKPNVDVLVAIGKKYVRQRKFPVAKQYYERALEVDSQNPWTHLYLGNLYYVWGKNTQAKGYFEAARDLAPDLACPYWCLGDVYADMLNETSASEMYEKAVHVDPEDEEAQHKLRQWNSRFRGT